MKMLEQWRKRTKVGNELFSLRQLVAAQNHYHEAIELANQLLESQWQQPYVLTSFVVSYHNLAECLQRQDLPQQAQYYLRSCYDQLRALAQSRTRTSNLQSAIIKSYLELNHHIQRFGCLQASLPRPLPDQYYEFLPQEP